MNTPTRLGAYGAGLLLLAAGGYAVGGRVDAGSPNTTDSTHAGMGTHEGADAMTDDMTDDMAGGTTHDMKTNTASPTDLPQGVTAGRQGYNLHLATAVHRAGRQQVSFRITGPDGKPVTSYRTSHEKKLHLIAVRRDFSGFQHVHPTLDTSSGTWTVGLDLAPGTWRIYTDFVPTGGDGLTLASDLLVPGDPGKQSLPAPQRVAHVDGYTVTATGSLTAGEHSMLDFRVTRDGKPVTDLQPYLGAYGHLVALRADDAAYLHVHPDGEPGDGTTKPGPSIGFGAEVPSATRYHLFLDFRVDGRVHTAAFTLDAHRDGAGTATGEDNGHEGGAQHEHDH
ncbi:MAG TPA: hypothetical protein VG502_11230 [Flexivirga sp.]|uniref:hypothetical protein n=1 Tax=Flexivirga sp. TaxID=1962927 RepID=UPI002CCF196B|nr:hypothetical protein [Flexivirga sp.]HWC22862.1 hypothetical protein [Flexivirga sp.]